MENVQMRKILSQSIKYCEIYHVTYLKKTYFQCTVEIRLCNHLKNIQ